MRIHVFLYPFDSLEMNYKFLWSFCRGRLDSWGGGGGRGALDIVKLFRCDTDFGVYYSKCVTLFIKGKCNPPNTLLLTSTCSQPRPSEEIFGLRSLIYIRFPGVTFT